MSILWFTTFLKLSEKADCAVSALAVLPTIPDLAEAWELRIKYVYALTLSDILNKPTSVKHISGRVAEWLRHRVGTGTQKVPGLNPVIGTAYTPSHQSTQLSIPSGSVNEYPGYSF